MICTLYTKVILTFSLLLLRKNMKVSSWLKMPKFMIQRFQKQVILTLISANCWGKCLLWNIYVRISFFFSFFLKDLKYQFIQLAFLQIFYVFFFSFLRSISLMPRMLDAADLSSIMRGYWKLSADQISCNFKAISTMNLKCILPCRHAAMILNNQTTLLLFSFY